MQITTATRTVEIYANTEAGITYRNVKDGAAYGPVRTANRATAKAGSVGREILDAIDALAAEVAEVETAETAEVAEVVAPVIETAEVAEVAAPVAAPVANCPCAAAGRTRSTHHVNCPGEFAEIETGTQVTGTDAEGEARTGAVHGNAGVARATGRAYVTVLWSADKARGLRPRYEVVYTDSLIKVNRAADTIRRAVNLKW